jgi:GGDEF domain-containing protein
VIYIDLDGFKAVDDAHGHAAGGALLKAVAGKRSPRM